jgi:hypothetical protein
VLHGRLVTGPYASHITSQLHTPSLSTAGRGEQQRHGGDAAVGSRHERGRKERVGGGGPTTSTDCETQCGIQLLVAVWICLVAVKCGSSDEELAAALSAGSCAAPPGERSPRP